MLKKGLNSTAKYVAITLLLGVLFSCGSMKPGSTSKAGKYYEDFYIGEGKNQYYIKPLEFKSHNHELKVDFTIRDFEFKEKGASFNFSIYSDEMISRIDSLTIRTISGSHTISKIDRMFFEKKGKGFHIRSTGYGDANQISTFFGTIGVKLNIFHDSKIIEFDETGSTKKARKAINDELMLIIGHY
ncbi:MAG: hypothetical protein KIT33_11590 [Candidatus Kapabacteria bacterium]|nr:hypothetical protein [Candidatus Kapabacteria bacterium]